MSEKNAEKIQKIQSKIEKEINPYITVKIPIPEGVDKEEFLRLECDSDFQVFLKGKTKDWLTKG
jgi:hypothetical protein